MDSISKRARQSNFVRISIALLLQACSSSTPPVQSAEVSAPETAASIGGSNARSAGEVGTPTAEVDQETLDTFGQMGTAMALSGQCSLMALYFQKFKGERDMLYMLTHVYLKNKGTTEPLCEIDVFSPTDEPRLQATISVAAEKPGGPSQAKRKRPDKYRAPDASEQRRLDAIQRAVATAKPSGFTIPVAFESKNGWLVELINYSLNQDELSLGPHYRVIVPNQGEPGAQLLSSGEPLALSNPAFKAAEAIELDHEGDTPNEVHAYLSLIAGKPLTVKTKGQRWRVHRGKIERLD